jgi:hypothetical protein
VYSLGCVLYEMLIGEPPGMWVTADSVQRGTFTDLPERHRAPMRDVERPVERALVRALAIRAHDRFDAVSAFLLALRADAGAVRRYSDSEVEEIVRQAADEQAAHPTEQGMSLRTVQQIADDVGISAERVQRAARKLEFRDPVQPPAQSGAAVTWLGGSTLIACERVVDGEVAETGYEEIVEEAQATLSSVGQAARFGRTLTWSMARSGSGGGRAVQIRVVTRGGQTRIYVQERLGDLAGGLFGGIVGGGGGGGLGPILGVGIGALGAGPEIALVAAGWVGGMYALARTIYRAVWRSRRTELEELSDRLAAIAGESGRGRLEGG